MESGPEKHVTWHEGLVTSEDRERLLKQRGSVVWLTGLSGSGKSTVSRLLEKRLTDAGQVAYVLDGDNVRHGLNKDLSFSPDDRRENIRRIGHVAALFADAGLIVITAFISPYRADRDSARAVAPPGRFVEVFLDVPLAVCEQRDPKGLYEKARAGEISNLTGVSAPYESPESPEIRLDAANQTPQESADHVLHALRTRGLINLFG